LDGAPVEADLAAKEPNLVRLATAQMIDVAEAAVELLWACEFLLPARPLESLITLNACGMPRARACGTSAFDVLGFDGGAPNWDGRLASTGGLLGPGRIGGLKRSRTVCGG
jgi:hypothetical protein